MKKIPLTKGKFAIVDDSDFFHLTKHSWHVILKVCGSAYASRYIKQSENRGPRRRVYMHTEVAGPGEVDHRDRDGLNNQRKNLRQCTRSQNLHNRQAYKNNTSGHKGVCWSAAENKWRAYINTEGKTHSLGYHTNKADAITAREDAEKTHHGEFAV